VTFGKSWLESSRAPERTDIRTLIILNDNMACFLLWTRAEMDPVTRAKTRQMTNVTKYDDLCESSKKIDNPNEKVIFIINDARHVAPISVVVNDTTSNTIVAMM